jgi:hypothetical protein
MMPHLTALVRLGLLQNCVQVTAERVDALPVTFRTDRRLALLQSQYFKSDLFNDVQRSHA